ncbi:MAG: glycosyltransferase family 39 protein [Luteimonas sp.]
MRNQQTMRAIFIALWAGVTLLKTAMAAHLPLFVDEAFYWQESRHLAWAYSDLPGLTAWLIGIGEAVFGHHVLALRLPFLTIAALLPWLVVGITARECDARSGWIAGIATLLLPLAGTLGLLALPDAPMALATLLCVDAGARLLRGISYPAASQLAIALAIGAFSHYRFIAVIGVGAVVLLMLPRGRQVLADPRVWIAIVFGAAAWTPLLAWNMHNAEAGLRFQLVDRHPWTFHADGIVFIAIQALLATPLLFAALLGAAWRDRSAASEPRRYLAWLGALLLAGFFALGFFADTQRVSFHWPLPAYFALLPLLPALLATWPRRLQRATWTLAALGLVSVLGYYVAVSLPSVRERSAALKWYPSNFAGWDRLADAVRARRDAMPAGTRIVADNFKIGAELGFALNDPDIGVLDHPLNRFHGRAPQLRLWGLHRDGGDWNDAPVLLVIGASDVEYRLLLRRYHDLCARLGPLPPPQVLNVDHGAQRTLLFAFDGSARDPGKPCVAPAMAWFDAPVSGSTLGRTFAISGWAFKDGVGIERVEVLLDGRKVADADYGLPSPGTAAYWKISSDPRHPNVGFRARVDASELPRGRHWLGLRLHGRDGSVEIWSEQPVTVK